MEKVEESLYSRMQPTWMRSDCGRFDAQLADVKPMKECARRSKGSPFKVILYFRGAFCHEFYCASIEEGHDAMRYYVEKE
jgi:hypothetical protein